MSDVRGQSIARVTADLVEAYRAVRRAADRLPLLRRVGVVSHLVDGCAAAERALRTRHSAPACEAVLHGFREALDHDDVLSRLNRRRVGLATALGIEVTLVLGLGLSILSDVEGLGESLVNEGADRGVLVLLFALIALTIQVMDRLALWDRRLDRPTQQGLRAAERKFYAVIGGHPPLVRRDQLVRWSAALVPGLAWSLGIMIAGLLYIRATSG